MNSQTLRQIPMFADLPPWQIDVVLEAMQPFEVAKGALVLESGTDDGFTYFLTEGWVALRGGDGNERVLEVSGDLMQHPLANLRPRILSVSAVKRVRGVRVPDIVLSAAGCNRHRQGSEAIQVESAEAQERRQRESRLCFRLYHDLKSDRVVLPSLPDLAMRIRQAIDDESSDARSVARLVEADPAMAAKLIKVANSAYFAHLDAAETCTSAVVRLGMKTTKQLVMGFALKETFRSTHAQIQKRMFMLWKHSAQISALCFVLARHVPGLVAEEALLVGLVHDLGVIAILNYVEQIPDMAGETQILDQTIARLRGELGAMILREWHFPTAMIAATRDAEDWDRSHQGPADLSDVLVVAQLHERLRKHDVAELPPLEQVSAVQRVFGAQASAEQSLEVLHDAKRRVAEMRSLLRA